MFHELWFGWVDNGSILTDRKPLESVESVENVNVVLFQIFATIYLNVRLHQHGKEHFRVSWISKSTFPNDLRHPAIIMTYVAGIQK